MLCESPRCGLRNEQEPARSDESGERLCRRCRRFTQDRLSRLPALYRGCESALTNRRPRHSERIRGGLPGGISLNDRAVHARSEVLAVLASWASLVVEERRLSAAPGRSVGALARFLDRHIDWLSRHPAAGDFADEIHQVTGMAEAVTNPQSSARVELGPCDQPGCASPVTAIMRSRDNGPASVSCGGGHVWRPHEWLMLGRRLELASSAADSPEPAA